jgi:hypothetical protein
LAGLALWEMDNLVETAAADPARASQWRAAFA